MMLTNPQTMHREHSNRDNKDSAAEGWVDGVLHEHRSRIKEGTGSGAYFGAVVQTTCCANWYALRKLPEPPLHSTFAKL